MKKIVLVALVSVLLLLASCTGQSEITTKISRSSSCTDNVRVVIEADLSPSAKRFSNPSLVDEQRWDLDKARVWDYFISDDGCSVEIVVGIDATWPKSYAKILDLALQKGGRIVKNVSRSGEIIAAVVKVDLAVAQSFVEEASGLSEFVEPNYKFQFQSVVNDTFWESQWGPRKIEADWAWSTTTGDSSILVAVIDTGIDYNHPDLSRNYVALGRDWVNDDEDPMDDIGHGTSVAGIIAAETNNSLGIAGLAQVKIMAEKVFKPYHEGEAADIANAIYHAVEQGADIINLSLGDYEDSELIRKAIKDAHASGVLLVASAGNDHTTSKDYPAAYNEVIAVAATDQYDAPWESSNLGNWVELAAPGVSVYSTFLDGEYTSRSGTSYAAPHVAGVAALIWSQFPNMTRDQVRIHLRRAADDLGESGFDVSYGYGRVNARKAVEQVAPEHDLLVLCWEKPLRMQTTNWTVINATVLNYGKSDESDVTVELLVNDTVVNSQVIDVLETGNSTTLGLWCDPTVEGMFNVTVRVVPVPDESQSRDNAVSGYVCVGGPATIKVPDHYSTIVEAVDAAISGDTIFVAAGTYYDANTVIRKDNLTLVGENKETTIIDGVTFPIPPPERWATLAIRANNVTVQGFTIREGYYGLIVGSPPVPSDPCECNGNVVKGNIITGRVLLTSDNNNVRGNILTEVDGETGIRLNGSHNNTIYNNTMINNRGGLRFLGAHNNSVVANYIANNGEGILFYMSCGNFLRNNSLTGSPFEVRGEEVEHYIHDVDFSNTLDGKPICYLVNQHDMQVPTDVAFMALVNCTNVVVKDANLSKISILLFHTFDSTIEDVTVRGIDLKKSRGVLVNKSMIAGSGAYIYKSSNNTIANNVFTRNDESGTGIEMSFGAEFNTIVNNTISNYRIGIYLIQSNNNTAYHNNFINNTHQTSRIDSAANTWDNGYPAGGNYWSDYDGTDVYHGVYQNETGSDGIGDTPYEGDNYPLMSCYEYWSKPIPGDINRDLEVNWKDLLALASAYGSEKGEESYNPAADLDQSGKIDWRDLLTLAQNYGKTA